VNPIWAYFNLSESDYLNKASTFYQAISGARVSSPILDFIQANGATYPYKGRIILVNREVASQTGTIQLAAEFPNASAMLRPGGFGRVRFQTGFNKGALLIPQAAVIEVQSMYQVVVVSPDNKANFRVVKVGNQVGTDWIITQGLNSGEKVIVQGFMKVGEGTSVDPKPFVVTLVGYNQARLFRIKLQEQTATYKETSRLDNVRFVGGATSFLEVLTTQQQYFSSELQLEQAWNAELQSFVQLYQVLGGGW
jgi:hypothetical protein